MLTDLPVNLLKIVDNGKVIAIAKLEVADEDNDRAWELFEDSWSNLSMIALASVFQCMRFATGRSAVPAGATEVIGLGIKNEPVASDIVIPNFRDMKGLKLNGS